MWCGGNYIFIAQLQLIPVYENDKFIKLRRDMYRRFGDKPRTIFGSKIIENERPEALHITFNEKLLRKIQGWNIYFCGGRGQKRYTSTSPVHRT